MQRDEGLPAVAAAPPETTLAIFAPELLAPLPDVMSTPKKAVGPTWMELVWVPDSIDATMDIAASMGIA